MVQREDWEELIQILKGVERKMPSVSGEGASAAEVEAACRDLRGLQATAAMLELQELEKVALSLENCLQQCSGSAEASESAQAAAFALSTLLEEMQHAAASNGGYALNLKDVRMILDVEETSEGETAAVPSSEENRLDFSHLHQLVASLGGEFAADDGTFVLRFEATPERVKQIETVLSSKDAASLLSFEFPGTDGRLEKVLGIIREFMQAMSSGDIKHSQEILLNLAEQQDQAGLYNEIGLMARELHNSLKNFMDTLDPALKEMVENKLPDSGNRLEHILELTEKAANITLDHVEAMQKRNQQDQHKLEQMKDLIGSLQAIGDQAQEKLAKSLVISDSFNASLLQTHEDLITVLTAQDYQDLTGQIIMKVMTLIKELELKLVNVIRVFGVKPELAKTEVHDELYGPAHTGKAEALHSQDDVDALLAEFGF